MRLFLALFAAALWLAPAAPAEAQQPRQTLRAFRNEREYLRFRQRLAREYERAMRDAPPPPPPPPPPAPVAEAPAAGEAPKNESVTNVQHAGVDEGGIVKTHGDFLVILRRGRLFTVRVGGNALEPVSAVDAYGLGIDPDGTWYDELLVADSLVAVIGYSYEREGSEVGLFRIDERGGLTHRGTYQLRSSDYYDSSNYASRLVGGKLVFYAPIPFEVDEKDPYASFPAIRRWMGAGSSFRRTAPATRVFRPVDPVRAYETVMHTVTVCDPSGAELSCESTALLGPGGGEFYVSPQAVYVWATQEPDWDEDQDEPARSVLYRMPLDGGAPSAVRVEGEPSDQFSFLESGDGHLNVVVQGADSVVQVSLLRLPLSAFGDGSRPAPAAAYRPLASPKGRGSFQNRFVGDWLLFGEGTGWSAPPKADGRVYAVRWAGTDSVRALVLPHAVDRIEAMGSGAVVVGSDGRDLHFSGVRLGERAQLADRYTRTRASQGETRSHGFFYRPEAADSGMLGLPIRGAGAAGADPLRHGSASVLFLRNRGMRLSELGELAARPAVVDDACAASCVDWYGNARPLFLRGRIFALMGYELVEGAEAGGRLRETRRVSFAPAPRSVAGVWEYDETVGREADPYRCRSQGTYRFSQRADSLAAEYQQTGQCTYMGRTLDNSGRGSGTGMVRGRNLQLNLAGCPSSAYLAAEDRMEGTFACPVRLPDGSTVTANGTWTARRR